MFTLFQRSLFLRVVAILLTTLLILGVTIQVLLQTSILFRLFPHVMEEHAEATAELVFLLENVPEEAVSVVLSAYSSPNRKAIISKDFPTDASPSEVLNNSFQKLESYSNYGLGQRETRFRLLGTLKILQLREQQRGTAPLAMSALEISIKLKNNNVLSILLTPAALFGQSSVLFMFFCIIVLAITSVIGLLFVFKPLKKLEQAANTIGLTSKPDLVEETGTEDIRRVSRAFNSMQARLKDLLAERSRMLAALAHDIRTCLTHIRLRLDTIEDTQIQAIESDVGKMERLVSDMMLYARSEQPSSAPELVELHSLIAEITTRLPYQVNTTFQGSPFWVAAERSSFSRALTNLIDNANTYAGYFNVLCLSEANGYVILVEDLGPGIPEQELTRIFDPFYRIEPSRNRSTGGSGLGLTIAKALFSAQGATLTLFNRQERGLSARVYFSASLRVQ